MAGLQWDYGLICVDELVRYGHNRHLIDAEWRIYASQLAIIVLDNG